MAKLNQSQIKTLQRLTKNAELYYGNIPEQVISSRIQHLDGVNAGKVLLSISNLGSPWFIDHKQAVVIIGRRGNANVTVIDGFSKTLINA